MPTVTPESVVVSRDSIESSDPYDVIYSNICFVNALLEEHLRSEELPRQALLSYYVDYYLSEVNNGGFSQFVYNSRWEDRVVVLVREGLIAMGASGHRELFEQGEQLVAGLGQSRLHSFLGGDYFDEKNPLRDRLNGINAAFFKLSEQEDIVALNAAWLRNLPELVMLSSEEIQAEVRRRAAAVPDRQERIAAARADEPRYTKLIRALCVQAGHVLDRVTAGDPAYTHEERRAIAWHFLTDQGHHYMVEADGKAIMFKSDSKTPVCEMEAPPQESVRASGMSPMRQVSRWLVFLAWGITWAALVFDASSIALKAAIIAVILTGAHWMESARHRQ